MQLASFNQYRKAHSIRRALAAANEIGRDYFPLPTSASPEISPSSKGFRSVKRLDKLSGKKDKTQILPTALGKKRRQKKKKKDGNAPPTIPDLVRVDRLLSERGVGSRSQARRIVLQGDVSVIVPEGPSLPPGVTKLRGRDITGGGEDGPHKYLSVRGPSERFPPRTALHVAGVGPLLSPPRLLSYNKPEGVLSAVSDRRGRPHLGDALPKRYRRFHPVGRLDLETTGLLLWSPDGRLTNRLLAGPVEREYVAAVEGEVDERKLKQVMEEEGVETATGRHFGRVVRVSETERVVRPIQRLDAEVGGVGADGVGFISKRSGDGRKTVIRNGRIVDNFDPKEVDDAINQEFYENPFVKTTDVQLIVKEGKHRMVRRMLANTGHPVVALRRIRHGILELGNLEEGGFREEMSEGMIEWIESLLLSSSQNE